MVNLFRIVQAAGPLSKVLLATQQAVNGDPDAVEYLKRDGIFEGLDAVMPGTGEIGRQVFRHAQDAAVNIQAVLSGNVIEGQYRVIDTAPWEGFVRWLKGQRWGSFVVIGPKGQGKTMLALRLAQVWHQETGYPVEMVMSYPEDRYDFLKPVSTQRFQNRIASIIKLLNPPDDDDEETFPPFPEDDNEDGLSVLEQKLQRYKRRIVIIDEMSLAVGQSGMDASRHMVRQIMAQARHLDWLIIYVGQLAKMLPNDLLNCEAVFVKNPNGREAVTDRDDALTRELWSSATQSFSTVRNSQFWAYYPDIRAWAYVDCASLGNSRSYHGMVPFSLPGSQGGEVERSEVIDNPEIRY